MSQRGPKPQTARTARVAPPSARDERWDAPEHLDDEGRRAWEHVVDLLALANNLDRTDPTLVEAYAINVSLLRRSQADLKAGLTVTNRAGTPVAHPAIATVNSATMRIKAIISDLGLCPATSKYAAPTERGSKAAGGSKWEGMLGVVGGS